MEKKTITVLASKHEHRLISAAAQAARMSKSAWMLKAAEEKLGLRPRVEPARPVEAKDGGEDAA